MTLSHAVRYQMTFAVMLACTCAFSAPLRTLDAQGNPPKPARAPLPPELPSPSTRPLPAPRPAPATPFSKYDMLYDSNLAEYARQEALEYSMRIKSDVMATTRAALESSMDAMKSARVADFAALENLRYAPLAALAPLADLSSLDEFKLRSLVESEIAGAGFSRSSYRYRQTPQEAWKSDDPADSLYREARKALSSDSYRKAADLFRRIRDQYPKSVYTPDAPYWEAFALQRLGNNNDLRAAKEALAWQEKQYPKATTRTDAAALATSIEGALARGGDRAAAATLYGRAESASQDRCPKQSDDDRVDALNALMQVDAEGAMPILKKVLARREPCTQNMRRTAVWLIASRKAPDAAEVLMNVAKTDPDREVREQAIFWLANVPTEEAANMLIGLAKGDGDLDARKRAVYALSRSKSPRAATALREIAADANAPVELRGDALNWFMSGPGRTMDDPMFFLKDVYGKADEARFKSRVIQIIAQRKSDASRDFLFSVAQNDKESLETRRMVVSMFSMMDVSAAQIATMYERSSEVELKRQLLSSLGSLSSRRDRDGNNSGTGLDQLISIARNEKNLELRKQAISQLTRSKDPRALAVLQEIIER